MIPAVHNICAGLDVHRKVISATVIKAFPNEEPTSYYREFSAFTSGLYELANWLKDFNGNVVAMESAGIYWVPVYDVLKKAGLDPYVVNPHHVKAIPGKKTDQADSHRIAHLFQHGLVRHSFVPEGIIRDLRYLTRSRARIVNTVRSYKNNTTRILDEANIKISAVATDLFGVSGQLMLKALINNPDTSPAILSMLARGRLRNKLEQLNEALTGFLTPTHINLLKFNMQMLFILKERLVDLERDILAICNGQELQPAFSILKSIPGIKDVAAATILAEIGNDMSYFPSAANLASWASVCPGNNKSAGKHYSGKIGKGNRYLRQILIQVAWAASRKKNTCLSAYYRRLARRKGKNRAIVALAHKILRIIYTCLSKNESYDEVKARGVVHINTDKIAAASSQLESHKGAADIFGASELISSAAVCEKNLQDKVDGILVDVKSKNNEVSVSGSDLVDLKTDKNLLIDNSVDKPPNNVQPPKRKKRE